MKQLYYILSIVIVFFFSCQETPYKRIAGETQGTTYHIIYQNDNLQDGEVDSILNEIDLSVSNYNPNSILYKTNENTTTTVDNHFKIVFKKAMEISNNSEGLFDITVGPLIKLYGFGPGSKGQIKEKTIDSLLQFVGYDKVKLEGNKLLKDNENIQIDMNALAQGYSVDYMADFFEKKGINNYMIEIGGEVLCKGENESGGPWRIGIEKPLENTDINERQIEIVLELKNKKKAIATSGNYRKFFVENGIKYTHTINPKTGYPAKDSLVSVTILADDCMTADGYATACLVSGFAKATEIVKNVKLEAFFIYFDQNGNYKFYFTDKFKNFVAE